MSYQVSPPGELNEFIRFTIVLQNAQSPPANAIKSIIRFHTSKLRPTFGALFSVSVYGFVMKLYRTVEKDAFYQKRPHLLLKLDFAGKKQLQSGLR